ncbi:hypothetical protein ACUN0G_15440 [Pseudomonas sp. 32A]|uniref:hypothetical protein n=1 Tax=Pseudomonas sp. 32A TaxID=651185 RepID=UPI0040465674
MKEITNLQGSYFSEPVNNTYYTLFIKSADWDEGTIIGRYGKGQWLGHSLYSGSLHWTGESSNIWLDMIFDKCTLRCDDKNFNRLYGTVQGVYESEGHTIVFNKAKDEIVQG